MIRSSKGKQKKRRAESKILHMVRMHDVARDGYCRVAQDWPGLIAPDPYLLATPSVVTLLLLALGNIGRRISEWAERAIEHREGAEDVITQLRRLLKVE